MRVLGSSRHKFRWLCRSFYTLSSSICADEHWCLLHPSLFLSFAISRPGTCHQLQNFRFRPRRRMWRITVPKCPVVESIESQCGDIIAGATFTRAGATVLCLTCVLTCGLMCGQMLYVHDTLTLIFRLARYFTYHSIVDFPVLLKRPLGQVVTHTYQALSEVYSQLIIAETY
jgi:hypothetical protein